MAQYATLIAVLIGLTVSVTDVIGGGALDVSTNITQDISGSCVIPFSDNPLCVKAVQND